MDQLTSMRVFVEVAEVGSLTQAAERLELSRAMVSRHVASLEQWLDARLLHRTTRRISLTDAGEDALPRFRQMLGLSDEVRAAAGRRRSEAVGKLRLTTSLSFAQAELAAALVEFQSLHPRVAVELLTVDRPVNLIEERIDLAVRITNQLDEMLVSRQLAVCRSVLCAAPAYLERQGVPQHPRELTAHNCVTHAFGNRSEYRLKGKGEELQIPVRGTLFSNETAVLRQAALSGGGIALLPSYYVGDDLREHRLVRLLPDYEPEPLGIHAVYLSRQHQPQALRLLIDFLARRFGGDPAPWDRGLAPSPPGRKARRTRPPGLRKSVD
jgi:DNA-binding transcriptional LysR family regulator